MLFRLRMTIDAAITAYAQFARFVFSEKKGKGKEGTFKSSRLEKAIVNIIMEQLKIGEAEARKLPLFDETGPKWLVDLTVSSFSEIDGKQFRLCHSFTTCCLSDYFPHMGAFKMASP